MKKTSYAIYHINQKIVFQILEIKKIEIAQQIFIHKQEKFLQMSGVLQH